MRFRALSRATANADAAAIAVIIHRAKEAVIAESRHIRVHHRALERIRGCADTFAGYTWVVAGATAYRWAHDTKSLLTLISLRAAIVIEITRGVVGK